MPTIANETLDSIVFYCIIVLEMLQFKLKTLIINIASEEGREGESAYDYKNQNLSLGEQLNQLFCLQAVKIYETTDNNVLLRLAMLWLNAYQK